MINWLEISQLAADRWGEYVDLALGNANNYDLCRDMFNRCRRMDMISMYALRRHFLQRKIVLS